MLTTVDTANNIDIPKNKLINRFIDKNNNYKGENILKKAFDFNENMDDNDNIWTTAIKIVDMFILNIKI